MANNNSSNVNMIPISLENQNSGLLNLADCSAGAKIIFATDEFFAVADNMIQPTSPFFDENLYDEYGKVMDGWESRRRRTEGHDWCIIQLAYKGTISAVEVDTAYFTGNHAPKLSLQGALLDSTHAFFNNRHRSAANKGTCATAEQISMADEQCRDWREILKPQPLRPGYPETRMHHFSCANGTTNCTPAVTHVRVNLFPDGGIARLKLWGRVSVDFYKDLKGKYLDLACASNGGKGIGCSNQHYGEPDNLLKPTKGIDMRDGWETARHPNRPSIIRKDPTSGLVDTDLMDWCILRLGAVADYVSKLIIDTSHFKGNFPESCFVEGCYYHQSEDSLCADAQWFPILNRTRLTAHAEHVFPNDCLVSGRKSVSHIRLSIYPDGGISRLRVFGTAKEPIRSADTKSNL